MSVSGIPRTSFDPSLLFQGGRESPSASAGGFGANDGLGLADFMTTLKSRIAEFQSQTLSMLIPSPGASADPLGSLLGGTGTASGLSASGRNTALFDPESAYRMMTLINGKDVAFKAEFAEMAEMKSYLATLGQQALALADVDGGTANADIHTRLQAFADAYNGWIQRFDEGLQAGGLLAGTQAAQVAQWELEQSVENMFNGARDGMHGMRDLGFSIDPVTNLASLDRSQLDAALASNKAGVLATVQELSANFARSAELLTSAGNFIPNRMDNLDRVIDYIDDNRQSLQAEFGLGNAARPSGLVAMALANYDAMRAMTG